MSLKITAAELNALKNLRANADRQGKKDWWAAIRAKYSLPAGVALKVELDGDLAGELRYKSTGEPLPDQVVANSVPTPATDTQPVDTGCAGCPADGNCDLQDTGADDNDTNADNDDDAALHAAAFERFCREAMDSLQDALQQTAPKFAVPTHTGFVRLFHKAKDAHAYASEIGSSVVLPVL